MIIAIIILAILITAIIIFFSKKNNKNFEEESKKYTLKNLITKKEKYFYDILEKNFNQKYIIQAQVNLASIINKNKDYPTQYQNELFRNIDFGIFDKISTYPLLLIEINDSTHNQSKRQYRDIKVKRICEETGIKLITFYTEYSNKEKYIVKRIKESLNEKKEEI